MNVWNAVSPLQKCDDTKPGKPGIEYADESWNPYTGCRNIENGNCNLGADCWAYSMAQRLKGRYGYDAEDPFKPTFHPDRLADPLKWRKPRRIAACFMGDIAYCPWEWLYRIKDTVSGLHEPYDKTIHRFYFLTKLPQGNVFKYRSWPENAWLGVSVSSHRDIWRIRQLKKTKARVKWVSFEPVEGPMGKLDLEGIDWVVIGAKTGRHKGAPRRKWVETIVATAAWEEIPIFIKPNLPGEWVLPYSDYPKFPSPEGSP